MEPAGAGAGSTCYIDESSLRDDDRRSTTRESFRGAPWTAPRPEGRRAAARWEAGLACAWRAPRTRRRSGAGPGAPAAGRAAQERVALRRRRGARRGPRRRRAARCDRAPGGDASPRGRTGAIAVVGNVFFLMARPAGKGGVKAGLFGDLLGRREATREVRGVSVRCGERAVSVEGRVEARTSCFWLTRRRRSARSRAILFSVW